MGLYIIGEGIAIPFTKRHKKECLVIDNNLATIGVYEELKPISVETKGMHNIEKESEVKISGIDEEVEEEEEGKGSGEVSLKEMEKEADDEEETGILEEKEEKMSENGKFVIEENIEEGGEEEEKEVVEEENWRLSTEEMNKKFEDFIRRMKEDLRIEAQRQVVMI
ncbi:neurofilament light polypeptide [Senna tora]|uniref:Neurofilament light polypeptide n=1 Tax=Senna tora TaxID=362788 RepID=A0A834U0W7_9FABA|nr:neurofilament light polypeptide [Senna tora]